MYRTLSLAVLVVLPVPSILAVDPPPLEKTLRQLEKDISAARNLEFKSPVKAKTIARPKDAAKDVQGYYSPKDKTLYVYDDVAGNYARGVLIHEMVHALQDQHFGLEKLHQASFGSDAELALAALIEGDATFTMIEVLKKEQPRAAAMLDTTLESAKDVQKSFLYAQGARYVKALKDRGGWQAVNAAYRNPPSTTAAVLHPEGVKTIDLGPGGTTRGEFALIAKLAARPETKPLCVRAAAGWMADRASEHGDEKTWEIAFTSSEAALRCQSALAMLHRAEHPEQTIVHEEPATRCWSGTSGNQALVTARGNRVFVIEAPTAGALRKLRDRLQGPLAIKVYSAPEKRWLTFGELIDRLVETEAVCIGETHDLEPCHRAQLEIIKALYARDERLGVGMEMFQRPFQGALDRYLHGETGEEDFLQATEYRQRWGFEWLLYRPIVEFCRRNNVPVAALNVPAELTRRLSRAGYAALTAEEKAQLGDLDFHYKPHRDYWYERLAKMHGKSNPTEEEKERSYGVMATWDDYMAASAAEFLQTRGLRRLVVLAGSGHVDRGFGIPERVARRIKGKVATIQLVIGGDPDKVPGELVADYTVIVKMP